MDPISLGGLVVTIVGTIATIWATVIATKQAKLASSSATEAVRAKNQIVNQRKTSNLAELKVHCERAVKSMEKYGPGASLSNLAGITPNTDASDVQTLLLEANKIRNYFNKGEAEIFIGKISPLLEIFVDSKEIPQMQINGKAVLMEVSNFYSVVRVNLDNKCETTVLEA